MIIFPGSNIFAHFKSIDIWDWQKLVRKPVELESLLCRKAMCKMCCHDYHSGNGYNRKGTFKTLASYRRIKNEVYFGQNILMESNGFICIRDSIEIIKTRTTLLA
jgi:hypothetical protein